MAADMQGPVPAAFFSTYSLRQLQTLSPRELETAGRLTTPLVAEPGATHYRAISWDDALGRIAARFKATSPDQSFFYFSGRSSNEAGYLLQLLARAHGTNNVNNCSYYCHQASGVGLAHAVGVGTATITADDIEGCDTFFLIGGNPASNHPRLMTHLMHLRRRGGQVIAINPMRETGLVRFRVPSDPWSLFFGTEIASEYAQPHIGGDIAVLMGIAKAVIAMGAADEAFVGAATSGYAAMHAELDATSWADIEHESGLTRPAIERLAQIYAKSERAIFAWTMGITHHVHGVANVRWIANLALLRGMVGKPHAGLLPIRGHSNVQGMGTVGVTPKLRPEIAAQLRSFGIEPPVHEGLDTMNTMAAAHDGRLKVGIALGGNLYGSNPDATYAAASLRQLDQLVYLSTSLNTGHAHGLAKETIILPVLARDEEPYATTQESMFSYVRLSDGGTPRHEGPVAPRAELAVISELGARLVGDRSGAANLRWADLGDADVVRRLIAGAVPAMQGVREIGQTKREFHIDGRAIHAARFPTPDGRARFHADKLPRHPPGGLRLMTVRSEGQFNTVVYEDQDLYRNQDRRDVILMSDEDMRRLGLQDDDLVTVRSSTGAMLAIRARTFPIKAGNAAMYCPEANVLIDRAVDPESGTPAFKHARVEVRPEPRLGVAARASSRGKSPAAAGVSLGTRLRSMLRHRRRPAIKSC
jgi:molybdopterin-dependent oxidoreductase alpha subunit